MNIKYDLKRCDLKNQSGVSLIEILVKMTGIKVTTGQVIQLRVTVNDNGNTVAGSLQCIEVSTGGSVVPPA